MLPVLAISASQPVMETSGGGFVKGMAAGLNAIKPLEPATSKYWFNYQGDHYFVPASNTKIPTCYAAMKYLGDSLVGLRYGIPEEDWFKRNVVIIEPTGDPSFLHSDYNKQPVFDFLKSTFLNTIKRK
jgi:D-alanyl-D-alanine carboxypeptidase/D-alanyl-D-alanine-endopeptidase (penicillin-binding protein 4)